MYSDHLELLVKYGEKAKNLCILVVINKSKRQFGLKNE